MFNIHFTVSRSENHRIKLRVNFSTAVKKRSAQKKQQHCARFVLITQNKYWLDNNPAKVKQFRFSNMNLRQN